jgi:ketosteroid isomerase-like protein
MTAGNGGTTAEGEIRALIDEQAKAIRAKDVEGSVLSYAPDVLLFDVVNPLRSTGSEAARRRLAKWFAFSEARSATSSGTSPSPRPTTWSSVTA